MSFDKEDVRQSAWPGRWFPLAMLILGLLGLLLHQGWLYLHVEQAHRLAKNIGSQLSPWMNGEKEIGENYFRQLVAREPRIGYLAMMQKEEDRRTGLINPAALGKAGPQTLPLLKNASIQKSLTEILQSDGYPGPYVEAFNISYERDSVGNVGEVRLGYVMPGFPFGRGYERVLVFVELGLAGILLVWLLGAAIVRSRSQKSLETPNLKIVSPEKEVSPETEGLDLLEEELDQSTLRMEVDDQGDSWRILFNGENLDDWDLKGEWHVSEETVIGQPWAASLTRSDLTLDTIYRFRFQGRKISGDDGFLVLFQVGQQNLTWVVGGWNNEFSAVGGYDQTKNGFSLEKLQWYEVEVRVDKASVEGLINSKSMWKLSREDIRTSSPDIGLNNGLGVGVWNAVARFKEFRFTMA